MAPSSVEPIQRFAHNLFVSDEGLGIIHNRDVSLLGSVHLLQYFLLGSPQILFHIKQHRPVARIDKRFSPKPKTIQPSWKPNETKRRRRSSPTALTQPSLRFRTSPSQHLQRLQPGGTTRPQTSGVSRLLSSFPEMPACRVC
jgi:hypothetical protein